MAPSLATHTSPTLSSPFTISVVAQPCRATHTWTAAWNARAHTVLSRAKPRPSIRPGTAPQLLPPQRTSPRMGLASGRGVRFRLRCGSNWSGRAKVAKTPFAFGKPRSDRAVGQSRGPVPRGARMVKWRHECRTQRKGMSGRRIHLFTGISVMRHATSNLRVPHV